MLAYQQLIIKIEPGLEGALDASTLLIGRYVIASSVLLNRVWLNHKGLVGSWIGAWVWIFAYALILIFYFLLLPRLYFLPQFFDLRGKNGFFLLHLSEVVVLEHVGNGILEENNPLDESFYVKLKHDFLTAFVNILHKGPLHVWLELLYDWIQLVFYETEYVHCPLRHWFQLSMRLGFMVISENIDRKSNLICKACVWVYDEETCHYCANETSHKR